MSVKAGVIGATGYAGLEIVRLLLGHPQVEIAAVSSVSFTGQRISDVYPQLYGFFDAVLTDDAAVVEQSDVVFASLPHGLSEPIARKCVDSGKVFIDMGADFRLHDEDSYAQWYGGAYTDKELHGMAVYSIPELHRKDAAGAKLIANPGCYPTSIALGLAPVVTAGAIDLGTLVIDSKSGVTGAGRGLSQTTHYPDCNEAFTPYKVACHRHTPEIEQTLSELSGNPCSVTFVPHLLPVNRGIVSTMYAKLQGGYDMDAVRQLYEQQYGGEAFVQVLPDGKTADLKYVKYSNMCHMSLHHDAHTGRLIVVSTIDNMVKGAAGQAIQNMNLALGYAETAGLLIAPPAF